MHGRLPRAPARSPTRLSVYRARGCSNAKWRALYWVSDGSISVVDIATTPLKRFRGSILVFILASPAQRADQSRPSRRLLV